ncbi:hypothetical protein GQ44DRAFT_793175 [Phaeosphaeriaceae sp. PMI808]|nr:hypothetical protein GQ44DRAFT_793175 [Phaeosphaeriaceae sp. PMI808]
MSADPYNGMPWPIPHNGGYMVEHPSSITSPGFTLQQQSAEIKSDSLQVSMCDGTSSYGSPSFASHSPHQPSHSTPIQSLDTESVTTGTTSNRNDLEYEDSDSGNANHNESTMKPNPKIEDWSITVDAFVQSTVGHYVCPLSDVYGDPCHRFSRPEHLRRHMNTVHGDEQNHICKVPECKRAFSRGDNLKDHYWTHLKSGSRRGKNKKMSLKELGEVLGREEKQLLERLERKLSSKGSFNSRTRKNRNTLGR